MNALKILPIIIMNCLCANSIAMDEVSSDEEEFWRQFPEYTGTYQQVAKDQKFRNQFLDACQTTCDSNHNLKNIVFGLIERSMQDKTIDLLLN